jgi:hypothetical protein
MKRTHLILLFCAFMSIMLKAQNATETPKNDKAIAKLERKERSRMTDAERTEIRAAKDKIRSIKQKYKKDKQGKKRKHKKGKHRKGKGERHHRRGGRN